MSETKPRGLAALSPERRKEVAAKAKATREAKKLQAQAEPSGVECTGTSAEDAARAVQDPSKTEKVVDGFRYTKDVREVAIWRTNPEVSPLHVPEPIRKKYPDLAFGWLSTRKMDKMGGAHSGWQVFVDGEFATSADGTVKRMNDTVLAAMPKELREKIDAAKAERAQSALLGLEETRVGELQRMAAAVGDPDTQVILDEQVRNRRAGEGIHVGRQRIANREGMLRERFIKQAEARSGKKKYFVMGGK